MKRFDLLIEDARRDSQNKEYSATLGIPQSDFVRFGNEAQERIFSEIVKVHPGFGVSTSISSCVANQEAYSLPDDHYNSMIEAVWYSHDGQAQNYRKLEQYKLPERNPLPASHPSGYIKRDGEILLVPAASSASSTLRIDYIRKRKRLEIRRGAVSAVTFSAPNLTALTIGSLATLDAEGEFAKYNHLSIVDREGTQKMAGVEYDSVNTGSGVVTLTGGTHAADSGETISTSMFVVVGKDSTNVAELPDICESVLVRWMSACALLRDGSALEGRKKELVDELIASVASTFADHDHDVAHVTILNTDFMDMGCADV